MKTSLTSEDGPASSGRPVDIAQKGMVGQQRQQISEMQFEKFPNPQSDSKHRSQVVLIFHRMLCSESKKRR